MSKCGTCKTFHDIHSSPEPACCKWFMDNVVICGMSVEDCTEYVPMSDKPDDTEVNNDFGEYEEDYEEDDYPWE